MRLLFYIIVAIGCQPVFAQYDREGADSKLQSALSTWKSGDTATTIKQLENFYHSYPDNRTSAMICLRLGRLYLSMGKKDAARFVLNEGLGTGRKWSSMYRDSNDLFYPMSEYSVWTAWICLLLSDLALESGDNQLSLHYLFLADTKHIPYWNCGTGMQDFRARLSPEIADAYLRLGDTTSAINRLVDYFIYDHDVVVKLKSLLLTRYTREEITKELNRAIAKAVRPVVVRKGEKVEIFKVFDREIIRETYYEEHPLINYLKDHASIKYLRD